MSEEVDRVADADVSGRIGSGRAHRVRYLIGGVRDGRRVASCIPMSSSSSSRGRQNRKSEGQRNVAEGDEVERKGENEQRIVSQS